MSKAPAPRLKLVIRRLPPTLPEDVFWRALEPFIDGKTLWKRFCKGRSGDNFGTHPIHSRAYILMKDIDSLVTLHAGFDGHLFRSKTGAEFQAVVEYAPVEKTPYKAKSKTDQRQGTIDDDPDYKSFLESLEAIEPKPVLETSTPAVQPTTTPLLDALRAQQAKSGASKKSKKEKEKEKKAEKAAAGTKAAALASITEAASKRAPKDKGAAAIVMVAGKGRDVYVGPADELGAVKDASNGGGGSGNAAAGSSSEGKKKKQRPPKKKKDSEEDKSSDKKEAPARDRASTNEQSKDKASKERKEKREPKEKKDKPPKDKGKGKEKDKEARGPKEPNDAGAIGKEPKEGTLGEEASADSKKGGGGRGRGRKGRGGGGGAGEGRGEGDKRPQPRAPPREAKAGTPARVPANEARIDM